VTDAIMSGLPPHIAQVICGHKNIDTTEHSAGAGDYRAGLRFRAASPLDYLSSWDVFIRRPRGRSAPHVGPVRPLGRLDWFSSLTRVRPWARLATASGVTVFVGHRRRTSVKDWP